jgi:hypothetical protein
VTITPGLAVELGLLTQALDLPGTDVAETAARLASDAQTAVESYLGLSVLITAHRSTFDLTVLNPGTQPEHIRASLLIPMSPGPVNVGTASAPVALVVYAATPGSFTDLAADLSWITGRDLTEFRLDEHLALPPSYADHSPIAAMSSVNQALGVLIGRGSTPEQAERDLHARAVTAGIDVLAAATLILASLTQPAANPEDR